MPSIENAESVNARLKALRERRLEMWEIGAGLRQPTQFQVVADGEFTRIRVVEGAAVAADARGAPRSDAGR